MVTEAEVNLRAIYDYIAGDSPAIADRVIRSLVASTTRLRDFPESGRPVEERAEEGVRELIVRPYLIAYRPEGETVVILRVWHGKKMLQPEEPR